MPAFPGYLDNDEINAAFNAITDLGLGTLSGQSTLLKAVSPRFANGLTFLNRPDEQLRSQLWELNREPNLRTGEVPIANYLSTAVSMAGDRGPGTTLDNLLRKVRGIGGVPPPPPAVTASSGLNLNLNLTPEAQVGAMDETLSVRYLRDGFAASRSVVKLLVHRHFGGDPEFIEGDKKRLVNGTGWMIAERLLITNHHVVNARRTVAPLEPDASEDDFALQAQNTTAVFDYVDDELTGTTTVPLAPDAFVCADKTLDFAILRLPELPTKRAPLKLRGHVIRKTPAQALGTKVNILQHALGKPMTLGFRNNYVVSGDGASLSYITDTDVGSSGSPVFDDVWTVGALHAGSRRITGDPIEILGHKYLRENHGVPVAAIMAHLHANHPAVAQEIERDAAAGAAPP